MKNLIKAEFHKIFHSRLFYTIAYILLLLYTTGDLSSGKFTNPHSDKGSSFIVMMSETIDMMILPIICAGIFMVYLWNKERKNGFIKNIAGNVKGRHMLTVSKLITGSAVVVMYSFATFVIRLIYCSVRAFIFGGTISYTGWERDPDYLATLSPEALAEWEKQRAEAYEGLNMQYVAFLIWILAGIVIIAFLLLLHELFRSAATGYVISIQFLPNILESLFAQLAMILFKFEDLGRYLIVTGTKLMRTVPITEFNKADIENYYPNTMGGVFIRLIIYLTVFAASAILIGKKRDV